MGGDSFIEDFQRRVKESSESEASLSLSLSLYIYIYIYIYGLHNENVEKGYFTGNSERPVKESTGNGEYFTL